MLTLDQSTLCKPLIPRELLFYLNVPEELVKFVPAYKGVIQIRDTGRGFPPVIYQPLRSPKSPFGKYVPGSSSTLPARFGAEFNIYEKLTPPNVSVLGNIRTNSEGDEGIKVEISDEDSTQSLNSLSNCSPYELK